MTGVTQQQLINAATDADTLEAIVNGGPTQTVTTRLGRVVSTVAKTVADMAAAINVNAVQFANKTEDNFVQKSPSSGLGKKLTIAEFTTANANPSGLASGTQRVNIVIPELGRNFAALFFDIRGYSYGLQGAFHIEMGCYSTTTGIVRINTKDVFGNVPNHGMYVDSNGDGVVYFEIHTSYPSFVVEIDRLLYKVDFGSTPASIVWTLAGTEI